MRRSRRIGRNGLSVALVVAALAFVVLAAVLLAALGGTEPRTRSSDLALRGGTLRVGLTDWAAHEERNALPGSQRIFYALDPQEVRYPPAFEIFRCCLLRTLLSYNGRPTEQGGAVPRPDLATEPPTLSSDGLTWTFGLKRRIRYAPPLEDVEIVAQDVIRALERELTPAPAAWRRHGGTRDCECLYDPHPPPTIGEYAFIYRRLIAGAARFADGKAESISGLEAPDPHTLVVHLVRPSGDVPYAFSLPATAPIPPNPLHPRARLGVAQGHDGGYGRLLVASGPYMLEGSERLDFSRRPDRQRAVSGYRPGRSFTLVRNPSWNAASDRLRSAYPDRIQFTLLPKHVEFITLNTKRELAALAAFGRKVDAGTFDLLLDTDASDAQLARAAGGRVFATMADIVYGFGMNLAEPPFDDVHVRRAANLVVDKWKLVGLITPNRLRATPAEHLAPDSMVGNLLLDRPPPTTGHRGDVAAARAEMARSRYDRDRDGDCDAPVCNNVRAIDLEGFAAADRLVARNLSRIGIAMHLAVHGFEELFRIGTDPRRRIALNESVFFVKAFPNASLFFAQHFSGAGVGDPTSNVSMLGAGTEQLERFGYRVGHVPSVDDKIAECRPLVGGAQIRCWAQLDQLLMTRIVPWVPYQFVKNTRAVSDRVARFSFDQLTSLPALDRIALRPRPQ
jgi:ABC-type transport system substrate-binding protein